jgi:tRNA (adenine57-N1/adenine58-N1)-methyltransferase
MNVKKVLVKKAKKEFVKELDREVTVSKPGIYYVDSLDRDYHTEYGIIKKKDLLKKDGSRIRSNLGKEFYIFSPSFIDKYRKIKRSAQIIPLKDAAFIIAETGINAESTVVDAGAGSAALACFLAHIVKRVVTYEIRDDFYEISRENIELLGLKNLALKKKDVYKGIDEKHVDLVTLDLPEPWKAIISASKALRPGGFLVAYNPSITQITDFVNELRKHDDFDLAKVAELIERNWEVDGRKVRPKTHPIGHSGFLVFARKLR